MTDMFDSSLGLKPKRPPTELRAQVLAAAREAAMRPRPGLFAALYHDHVLRLCGATLFVLALANVWTARDRGSQPPVADPGVFATDDAATPGDTGLTAPEQLDDLAPVLGDAIARSRG